MKPLPPEDLVNLKAAQGWLELGNRLEANQELENITPRLRSHPDVLEVRWEIYPAARQWELCLDIAEAIVRLAPVGSLLLRNPYVFPCQTPPSPALIAIP